ncbi:MAG TPA: glycerol-3-phosphate acyltransferase [Acidimicrobiia bacterium]
MTLLLTALVGYLIGSLPTANAIARLRHIDLRQGGSGNPGTNNARRLGGIRLAAPIFIVEFLKGVACVALGGLIAGDAGSVVAGVSGIAGNVFNVWYRFAGGKGLAITGGVLLALWPAGFVVVVATIAVGALVTKSTGIASLIAIVVMIAIALPWAARQWPNGWGIENVALIPYLAIAVGVIVAPKHLLDARDRLKEPSRS